MVDAATNKLLLKTRNYANFKQTDISMHKQTQEFYCKTVLAPLPCSEWHADIQVVFISFQLSLPKSVFANKKLEIYE